MVPGIWFEGSDDEPTPPPPPRTVNLINAPPHPVSGSARNPADPSGCATDNVILDQKARFSQMESQLFIQLCINSRPVVNAEIGMELNRIQIPGV